MNKKLSNSQSGIAHLVILLVFVTVLLVFFMFVSTGVIKDPIKSISNKISQNTKEPTVKLQTAYKNPFDKSSQYVNPFSIYKNPFDAIK